MDRTRASKLLRDELNLYGLKDWSVRLTTDFNQPFLGLCSYKDKAIILNAAHVDIHPEAEVICTIKHEVAHALCPGQGHNEIWAAKAREIGCDNVQPCSHLSIPEHVIDAIRSGANVEKMTVEEEVITNVIRTPKYTVTRLQEKCPVCGKVAVEKLAFDSVDKDGDPCRVISLECFHVIEKKLPKVTPFESLVSNWHEERVAKCIHAWPTKQQEELLGVRPNQCIHCKEYKLLDFQVIGARAIETGLSIQKGFAVFDDMGLGKTVQDLAYLKFHPEMFPALFVVKSALMFQWFCEIIRWLGPKYLPQIISSSKDVPLKGLKCYIISYDLLRRYPKERIDALKIKIVTLDECQQIKNVDSGRTQQVRKIVSDPSVKVIPLSGTPWYNRGGEFFPVLNMLSPTKFWSNQRFLNDHVEYYYEGNKRKQGGIKNPKKFREYIKDICIRREFDEVMDEFPSVNRTKLSLELEGMDKTTFDEAETEFVNWYNDKIISGEEESMNGIEILGKMARMRHLIGLAKIPATMGFVEEFVEDTNRSLVIFVHHKDVGEILYEKIKEEYGKDITVLKVTAAQDAAERYEAAQSFKNAKRAILVASTQAGGEGLDGLQVAYDAVMHERQWNPQREDQAAPGRLKRYGQKSKIINVTFPHAIGGIDDDLDTLNIGKRQDFHEVMNNTELPTWNENDFAKQLAKRIVERHNAKNKNKTKKVVTV